MKRALCLLIFYLIGEVIAVIEVDDIIIKQPRNKCKCCFTPCCCKCAQRITVVEHTTPPIPTTTTAVPECNSTLDIAFIVDMSGSISDTNWEIVKTFIKNVVSFFTISRRDTRVAMTTYSTNATVNWKFNSPKTASLRSLQNAIDSLVKVGAFTNTVEGMEKTTEIVFVRRQGDRATAPNVAVVITDGKSNYRKTEVKEMSERLKAKTEPTGGGVVVVGVTDEVNQTELSIVATGEGDDNVFNVDSFDALKTILQGLVTTVCEQVATKPPPTTRPPTVKVEEHCICVCPPVKYDHLFEDCKDCYDDY